MKKILILLLTITSLSVRAQVFTGNDGAVNLKGIAPLETITAKSASLSCLLDAGTKKFNFKQNLTKFVFSQGDLQKKHAEESYWETDKFPNATFKGEIMNDIDLKAKGTYQVTAKGIFSIHGIEKEMKIPATVEVGDNKITVKCNFKIYLSDFKIAIPRMMERKVSDEFLVDIIMILNPKVN